MKNGKYLDFYLQLAPFILKKISIR